MSLSVPGWAAPALGAALPAGTGLLVPERRAAFLAVAAAVAVAAAALAARTWLRRSRAVAPARGGWALVSVAALVLGAPTLLSFAAPGPVAGPGLADAPVALAWPVAAAGTLALVSAHARGRHVDAVVEGLLVAAPIAYLAAAFLLDGRPGDVSLVAAATAVAAVVADVVLVVLAVELVRSQAHARPVSAGLLAGGAVSMLAGHAARAAALLAGIPAPAGPAALWELLALLPAVLWACAALHPDARLEPERAEGMPTPLTRGRLVVVLVSVLVGPLVLAMRLSTARADGVAGLAAGAVVVAGVAVAYLVRLVEQRARVEYLALHDDLSGLPNRVLLGDRIGAALAHAQRHGGGVALLYLDLDRFKTINDSLGHAAGNDLLRAVAERLRATVRSGDTVARLGGDEFAVLLPQVQDPSGAATVAEKILESFGAPFDVASRQLFVSPSVGVALHPEDGANADELLRNADAAMYRAKENGRNTFHLYTAELNARAHQRLTLESSLHQAIERGELVLHYQPKVELRSGRVVGMEALVRWQHPELGLVPPKEFIPLAEDTGLIVPLGEWALEQACAQAKAWCDAGHDALTVSVNLSARQFQHQHVGDMVARVLRSTRLDPRALELELTESLALQDPDAITATLRELKDMGVQCSIDDFGTGYSGLRYLTRFPIDKVKIDRFFVGEISNGGDSARIVAAVIALAHGLRLDVIAEGVETDEQLRFLLDHGCDEMQGFLFSRAIPAEEFEALLAGGPWEDGPPVARTLRVVAGDSAPALHDPAVSVRVHADRVDGPTARCGGANTA